MLSFKYREIHVVLTLMSTPEFDEFDLEGLSLEDVEPAKPAKAEQSPQELLEQELLMAEPVKQAEPVEEVVQAAPPPAPTPAAQAANQSNGADLPEGQMICPKCELVQPKAEQCSGCGVYVAKAQAQIGQSKIEITSTKF